MVATPQNSIHERDGLSLVVRELYSRRPETRFLEPYALQSLLWSLGYCDDLIPECEIAAAVEVARLDCDPDEGVA